MIHFTRTFDLLIEEFQDRDLDRDSARNICHCCVVLYFSGSFHKGVGLSGSLVLYMCEVSVGSVLKILSVLTQSNYVVQYKRRTLQHR